MLVGLGIVTIPKAPPPPIVTINVDPPPVQVEPLVAPKPVNVEQRIEAGILGPDAAAGLKPSSNGKRVAFDGVVRTVCDGPFAATTELIAGYWLWTVKDMDEALDGVKRCLNPMPGPSEIEMRPLYEMADFQRDRYLSSRPSPDDKREEGNTHWRPALPRLTLASVRVPERPWPISTIPAPRRPRPS